MRMVKDRSGRFPERPHYPQLELDVECERIMNDFLNERHRRVEWPVTTEDLTCLLERDVEDLDLYADLSDEGIDVEGVTEFRPGRPPRVRISAAIAGADHRANRLRTTLTHELGHVRFHRFLFELRAERLDLFDTTASGHSSPTSSAPPQRPVNQKCLRAGIMNAAEVDWMEWQAGYACGAFLMPATPLRDIVRKFLGGTQILHEPAAASPEGVALIAHVARSFDVSQDAASVRLLKMRHLSLAASGSSLF